MSSRPKRSRRQKGRHHHHQQNGGSSSSGPRRKVSFKATDESGKMTQIDFKRKKKSVFLDEAEVSGLSDGSNTIQRSRFESPSRSARNSNFGIDSRTALQRKSSTYSQNPCGESVALSESQRARIAETDVLPAIKAEIEALDGAITFDKESGSLRLILEAAASRGDALRILQKFLGPLDASNGGGAANDDEQRPKMKELVFPLTDDQL